jgi:GNAT superfamily N-acetyltransferase
VSAPALSRVQVAHADAWQFEGRLREPYGGGALEVRGLRLMASGLAGPQWNSGDVTAPDADLAVARAFYRARGAAWGLRVPAGLPWRHGRRLKTLRLMALASDAFAPAPPPPGVAVRAAHEDDLETVLAIDAEAFGEDPAEDRGWIAPRLGADGVTTALATLDGEPVATGLAIRTDGRAGPALYVAGVATAAAARRRGIGAAVSSWLVAGGLEGGARFAHLHADNDPAARVYARLGFAEAPGLDVYVGL